MKRLLFACVLTAFPGAVNAGVILQPATATTTMGRFAVQFLPRFAIDQSGLSVGYTTGVTDFSTYLAGNPTHVVAQNTTWYSTQGRTTGNFDTSLGALFDIQSMALWNESQGVGQGINRFNLFADTQASFATATLLGTFSASEGLLTAEVFSFAPVTASHVRIQVLSNHGSQSFTGVMEIAFESVPEPASAALLGLGLLGLGFALRAKRA
jgi:hypothetical protein